MLDDFEEEDSIDITPLIDCVFMLLVFFIMTTTFSKPVLDIILPKSEMAARLSERPREIVVSVREDGRLYHNQEEVAKEELVALLARMPDALLDLHVDAKAPFQSFVEVVDIAKQREGGRFVISTRAPSDR
ncbi:MAG TPA: biopolymer transporter ExbD [Candidatus Desulfovibrio intestinipullorum]|uniref:Biopolymer transporter ExbD n=1 Tax=Candidatus Desulfovibrio intestinipullorum TaxID=2838536 RepID=A0A9D1PYC9_9BACT|nr:biopolymer transporter ExbD [Candidatus Desulfovibrio intestinipullorum]